MFRFSTWNWPSEYGIKTVSAFFRKDSVVMKIHEYQGKQVLEKYGVPVPKGRATDKLGEVEGIAKELGTPKVVVKAQIHAGGRGKGGGVKVVDVKDVKPTAEKILGMKLKTHQTGPDGQEVRKILIEEAMDIQKELYIGILIDRSRSRPVIMASEAGGMEIEEVASATPEKIFKVAVDPAVGIQPYQARQLVFKLGIPKELIREATSFIMNLYRCFVSEDCSLAEINPLILTGDGRILALDCKMTFDDNALYRHKDIVEFRDLNEEDPLEIEASKHELNYIKLDGNIGCMVNGAGLAMATMDIIKHSGGQPANFLDVGGGANEEQVENAFRIILADKNVKAVFINILGGILRCDRLATGVVNAAKKVKVDVPVIIRMEGTNMNEGRAILNQSGMKFILANGMRDGAEKAVAALKSQVVVTS
jgi:succinyl-CoA synthetase beta subunit